MNKFAQMVIGSITGILLGLAFIGLIVGPIPKFSHWDVTEGTVIEAGTCNEYRCAAKVGDEFILLSSPVIVGQTIYFNTSYSRENGKMAKSVAEGYWSVESCKGKSEYCY